MGSATQLAQHDRGRNLSKGSPQLRGSSRRGAEAQNTSTHLSKDSTKLGKFGLEHGGHQEKTTEERRKQRERVQLEALEERKKKAEEVRSKKVQREDEAC